MSPIKLIFNLILSHTVIIQMNNQMPFADKENRHPNRKVTQADISTIAKTYVFDGQRVKAKSILYRDTQTSPPKTQIPPQTSPVSSAEDFHKLEYLEKLGVLTKEEQTILQQMRKMPQFCAPRVKKPLCTHTSELPKMQSLQCTHHFSQSQPFGKSSRQNMSEIQCSEKESFCQEEGFYQSFAGQEEYEKYGMYPEYPYEENEQNSSYYPYQQNYSKDMRF